MIQDSLLLESIVEIILFACVALIHVRKKKKLPIDHQHGLTKVDFFRWIPHEMKKMLMTLKHVLLCPFMKGRQGT